MKKLFIIGSGLLLLNANLFAQPGLKGLVKAEQQFAAYSKAHGARPAFLSFADTQGLLFENGNPVNAISTWTQRKELPGRLTWSPSYAEIAASADFGCTAGPWLYQQGDSVQNRGYFITVWHRNSNNKWKFLVDLGVNLSGLSCDETSLMAQSSKVARYPAKSVAGLRERDQQLIDAVTKEGSGAYSRFLSAHCLFYRNGSCVAENRENIGAVTATQPPGLVCSLLGSGMSRTGDLGYTYGSAANGEKKDVYLRIWRRENNQWMLALEVLRY